VQGISRGGCADRSRIDGQRHDTKWTTGPGGIVLSVTGVVRPLCATLPIGTLADESSGIPREPRSIVIDRGLPFK